MRKIYALLMSIMLVCIGCEWRLNGSGSESETIVNVERYDRIQSLYLTTGDFSALQQMNTSYPQQTRTLIASAEQQYANMDDINKDLSDAFSRLRDMLPNIEVPQVYAQIGSLDQSIIVGNGLLGISLDKYLGSNYPLYLREDYGYMNEQRDAMTRDFIVPDCIGFYLLSLYPMPNDHDLTQLERDMYIGKVQWVVNQSMNKQVFNTLYTRNVGHFMKSHPNITTEQLLRNNYFAKTQKVKMEF